MPFVIRRYLHLLRTALFGQRDIPPLHRRSLAFCLRFLVMFPLLEVWNALCLLLDNVLFPGWRRTPLRQPIFVVGNPRSGTTLMHRILAGDERFFCFKTWQLLFPSVLQKRVLAALGKLDRRLGSPLRSHIERNEQHRLAEFNRYHQVGLFLPEEDGKVLIHNLALPDLGFFFPFAGFDRFAQMDHEVGPAEQRDTMKFYTACVRRQAYFAGGNRSLISKNPFFTGKIENLIRQFPDCKIIYMVRNPLDVVASAISLMRAILRLTINAESGPDLDRTAYEGVKHYYFYPLERLSRLPSDRCALVNYDELLKSPREVIRRIYRQFGLSITPQFEKCLEQEAAAMRAHKSRHSYSLEDQCIPAEQIVADLWPVFERFGFDTRGIDKPDLAAPSSNAGQEEDRVVRATSK